MESDIQLSRRLFYEKNLDIFPFVATHAAHDSKSQKRLSKIITSFYFLLIIDDKHYLTKKLLCSFNF